MLVVLVTLDGPVTCQRIKLTRAGDGDLIRVDGHAERRWCA